MLIDLHVHTDASECSNLPLDYIVNHAAGYGLGGVCITDHHCVDTLKQIKPGIQANGLRIFVGQEYHTRQGDFLIFGPEKSLAPNLSARDLLALVTESGGIAIAAHPFRQAKPTSESVIREKLCRIVESVNGRNRTMENQGMAQWRSKYDLIECGGSDAHSTEELGTAATRFHRPIDTMDDLILALKNGHCEPYRSSSFKMVS